MKILVVGARRLRAGKTTFSLGLVEHTGAVGFKPRAGNDYWHHHDQYRETVAAGRLYGHDAARLAAASGADVGPEDVNPIHRLWRPLPGRGSGLLGIDDRDFVLDRVGDGYVVNETVEVPERARENLPLEDAVSVGSLAEFNDVMADRHVATQRALLETVRAGDRAVVESYAETARPLDGFEPDAVAVVEPERVRLYDGSRYVKGCEVASGSAREGRLEERVGTVTDLLDPESTVSLPPLTGTELSEPAAVASAYEAAYDRLLAVVFE